MATQTNIISDGFRSLAEGEPVEFTIENGDDGRTKAINVSGPGGAAPQVLLLEYPVAALYLPWHVAVLYTFTACMHELIAEANRDHSMAQNLFGDSIMPGPMTA